MNKFFKWLFAKKSFWFFFSMGFVLIIVGYRDDFGYGKFIGEYFIPLFLFYYGYYHFKN